MASRIKLSELSDFICCPICKGILNDAQTITECLHSFCKKCIIKHIKKDPNNRCPKCRVVIHRCRPLDFILQDSRKQEIVYKLVPRKPDQTNQPLEVTISARNRNPEETPSILLECPLTVEISHLKKILWHRYQVPANYEIVMYFKGDIVSDGDRVSNLAQSLTFLFEFEVIKTTAND